MKILVVDNEEIALKGLCRTIKEAYPETELCFSTSSRQALELAKDFKPSIAFLDIEMPEINGLELAKKLKQQINPLINIIFSTGYNEYIEEAFTKLRASGYLLKPITREMVVTEMENLRYPQDIRGDKKVRVRCFGAFEVFVDDKPLSFHYSKTKELCAYLIDHGGMCAVGEITGVLWEDDGKAKEHRSYLQNVISDLVKTFAELDCNDIVLRKYGSVGIDSTKIDCDYYEYINGNPAAVNSFKGVYMPQYSWAEKTLATMLFENK